MSIQRAILLAGPTASGKSAMALDLARENDGVIVNADAMQVYGVLDLLTARPGSAALAAAPHELYGHVHPSRAYSVAAWLSDVRRLAAAGAFEKRTAIFTGGTGLYFSALTQGLSDIPAVPPAVRESWRARLAEEGASTLHRLLAERDPEAAARLRPGDGQRIVRALEVLDATGRPLSHWRQSRGAPLVDPDRARMLVLDPDRARLSERISARFEQMVEAGALDEVGRLLDLGLDPSLPAMKAIGVRELAAVLAGALSLDEAKQRAKAATRQYAKRQMTWFRNQLGAGWARLAS